MTAEDLDGILAKQMPNDEKCRRADYVIPTDTMEDARGAVRFIVDDLKTRFPDA
jgi:dephospho-CoA kinase